MNLHNGGYPMRDDHLDVCDEHGLPYGCCATCIGERSEGEWKALAAITGLTVEELLADMTAPEPREEDGPCF